jgi:hypothetical protein
MKSFSSSVIAMMAACCLPLFAQGVRVIPLKQFSFNKDLAGDLPLATIAFDTNEVYISSPDGVVLGATSLASDLRTVYDASSEGISGIYVNNHVLYVLTNPATSEADWHAMFQSKDQGATFTAIDNGLQKCVDSTCYYLVADQLFAQDNLLFSNAGGGINLSVSSDEGETWSPLSGELEGQVCYSSPFEIVGRTVLQGGECPLDHAFLSRGVLSQDKLSFSTGLTPVQTPDISNRKIYSIGHQPGASVVLAGAEGALLRSADDGHSWNAVIEEPDGNGFYPYVTSILFASNRPHIVLAGGFDKGSELLTPYLAYSTRDGSQWTDITSLLGNIENGAVTDLKEDTHGRLIAVVVDAIAKTVTVDEVRIQR